MKNCKRKSYKTHLETRLSRGDALDTADFEASPHYHAHFPSVLYLSFSEYN